MAMVLTGGTPVLRNATFKKLLKWRLA